MSCGVNQLGFPIHTKIKKFVMDHPMTKFSGISKKA
jgi:hypothetical protein